MKRGKIGQNIYKRSIEKLLPEKTVEASCDVPRGVILRTGYFEGKPIDAAKWSAANALNHIWADKATPKQAELTIVLPEKMREINLKNMMGQVKADFENFGVTVTGGHTQVSSSLTQPVMSVCILGIKNESQSGKNQSGKNCYGNLDIVMTGFAGAAGTSIKAADKEDELKERFPVAFVDAAIALDTGRFVKEAAAAAEKSDAVFCQDGGQGGIFGALWNLAEGLGVGLEIEMRKILFRQETIEICEVYDLNPYELLSTGVLLIATQNGTELKDKLEEKGIRAEIIGRTTESNDRVLITGEERRFLEPVKPDQIFA